MNKAQQRQTAYARRNAQVDKDVISREICRRFIELPDMNKLKPYFGMCIAVRKCAPCQPCNSSYIQINAWRCHIVRLMTKGNTCLGLWLLKALDELQPGMWNILEPPKSRWGDSDRRIEPAELDMVMVPGVGFRQARWTSGQWGRLL
jgi:5-formyltetrahydrofolate cyclo-ligase